MEELKSILLTIFVLPICFVGSVIMAIFYAIFSFFYLIAEIVGSVICDIWGC